MIGDDVALGPGGEAADGEDRRLPGAVSREITVCNRITIIAANTTGSTVACGMEPCPPRPWTVIRMLSAADSTGPEWVPTTLARRKTARSAPG